MEINELCSVRYRFLWLTVDNNLKTVSIKLHFQTFCIQKYCINVIRNYDVTPVMDSETHQLTAHLFGKKWYTFRVKEEGKTVIIRFINNNTTHHNNADKKYQKMNTLQELLIIL